MSANTAESLVIGGNAEAPLYVINLCASTSPMALTHPGNAELKRYTFFVTRQREEGRERFRLHMGYFATQEEAEHLLVNVRDVYPAAWAGPAPTSGGAPRRARAVPSAAAEISPPAAPAQPAAPAVAAAPAMAAAPAQPAAAPAVIPAAPTLESMSNVRDVLAQLSDDAAPVSAKLPQLSPPRLQDLPKLQPPLSASQMLRVLELQAEPTPERAPRAGQAAAERPVEDQVRVITPEDTQTLRDIRLDAQNNAPPCFAVQLLWSVAPIDISSHPHLAIFDAYTLYNVEGSRQGRRWYGLRLGFFSDPSAATQVALYVRADYSNVVVVPVAVKEREHAGGKDSAPPDQVRLGEAVPVLQPQLQTPVEKQGLDGFELLQDDRPVPVKRDVDDAPAAKPAAAGRASAARAATPKATGKRVTVRRRPAPEMPPGMRATPGAAMPLESTLEILGASTLTLDEGREIINDSAVRKPVQKKKPGAGGRFARLLNRLGS
jgi:hypothetical protein